MKKDRKTLEDALIAIGGKVEDSYKCPACNEEKKAFAIVDVIDISEISQDMICSNCYLEHEKKITLKREAKLVKSKTWDSELGNDYKAIRNRKLNEYSWILRADSPASEKTRKAFAKYFTVLHRMTVDSKSPDKFLFPNPPKITYMSEDKMLKRINKIASD